MSSQYTRVLKDQANKGAACSALTDVSLTVFELKLPLKRYASQLISLRVRHRLIWDDTVLARMKPNVRRTRLRGLLR